MARADSRRGIQRERDLVRLLRSDPSGPWVALRAPASLGVADVIAVRAGEIRLIEVKSTRSRWSGFGPADRARLVLAARQAGGTGYLVWWPKGRGAPLWIHEDEFPGPA